jgi:hypothetical protein
VGAPPPAQQYSGIPFSPENLQGFISQYIPHFGFSGVNQPFQQQSVGFPQYYNFFSPLMILQFDIMSKMAMLQQMMNGQEGGGDPGWNQEFSRRGRGRGGNPFGRDPLMRGNDALDTLLEKIKVGTTEADLNTDKDAYHFSDEDVTAIKQGLQQGQYTQRDLGLALMSKMKRVNANALDEFSGLITRLVDEGALDARALFNPYLRTMKPERQEMVSKALGNAGMLRSDGSTNTGFSGYFLSNIDNGEKADLQAFLRDLAFRFYQNSLDDPDSDEAKAVQSLLKLTGFEVEDNGTVVAGEDQPFELKAYLVPASGNTI